MSEQALPDHTGDNESSAGGDVIPLDPSQTELFIEVLYDDEGVEISRESYEIWPFLDIRLDDDEIHKIGIQWLPNRVFTTKESHGRPAEVIKWLMLQTHSSVDASKENEHKLLYRQKEKDQAKGTALTAKQKKLEPPTSFELAKIAHANAAKLRLDRAISQLEDEAANGLSDFLDYLLDVEDRVSPRVKNTNIARLFNVVDERTSDKDRGDMIVAKRLLLIMLDQELRNQSQEV